MIVKELKLSYIIIRITNIRHKYTRRLTIRWGFVTVESSATQRNHILQVLATSVGCLKLLLIR